MAPRQTKAERIEELEHKVAYWQEKYRETSEQKDEHGAEWARQVRELQSCTMELTDKLRSINEAWNQWVEADKNLDGKLATIKFPHEAFTRLLYLLKP